MGRYQQRLISSIANVYENEGAIVAGGVLALTGAAFADTDSTGGTFMVPEDDLIKTLSKSGKIQAKESTGIMCKVESYPVLLC